MMDRINELLSKLNPRLVYLILLLILFLLAFEGWYLLLRKPYAEYQQIAAKQTSLSAMLNQNPDNAIDLDRMADELRQLTERLSGELRLPAADDKMAASLMKALDHSAASYQISLSGVRPGERKPVSVFEELSFDVTAKGPYLQLCAWMLDFDRALGNNATISKFGMKSTNEGKLVMLDLKLALYRPLKLAGGVP